MLSLREAHQDIFNTGSEEESHLYDGDKNWRYADGEGFPHNIDGAALQDVRNAPIPGDLHQETDLKKGTVGDNIVDGVT